MAHPNIVYILADDMGYGDVRHLNPDSRFPTPNLDRIGREGMAFTDAHSSSSVCTPSRYSILTGRYCWRTYLKSGVTHGADHALIEPDRLTVASLLRQAGYRTGCIGKWHLGWDWAVKADAENETVSRNAPTGADGAMDWIDYSQPIAHGPTDRGFDTFYGMAASLDMPPYVYVEDDRPVEEPTRWSDRDGFCRAGYRMESMEWDSVLPHLTDRAVGFIEAQTPGTPFFLYFPLTAPHTPIAPAAEFRGRSGLNAYADFCMEVDHRVGQVLDALDRTGLADNTLIIFTTDNGASCDPSECPRLEKEFGHYCSYIYRGYKSDIWDGGHRLPFLARWPGVVEPGSTCDERIGLFDLIATAADITGQPLPDTAAEDAASFLPALRGEALDAERRQALVHHSIGGMFALRRGRWKLCRCPGSGGWGRNDINDRKAREQGLPEVQLYDMTADPGEKDNLADRHPEVVEELTRLLHRYVVTGRSTPGRPAPDAPDRPLEDWKQVNWLPEIPDAFVADD